MSQNLLADLREIAAIARELKELRDSALSVIVKSSVSADRVNAISAIALIADQRLALRAAFQSLQVVKLEFDDLLEQTDDDLVRAQAMKEGREFYLMRDGELGGAALPQEVTAGLEAAFPLRLGQIREGSDWVKELLKAHG
jgi:hypothetical protein